MGYYGGWKPYVPVAERRKKAERQVAKEVKSGKVMSPITPYRGAIAKTFWGKAWCDNLEHYSDYDNRLPRGRTYVRNGSVIDLQMTPGTIHAQVMGSDLYTIKIDVTACPAPQWRALSADCSSSIDSMVELLQGKLSAAVMERICKPRTGLFPSPKDIQFACNCPDWASMCKHVAAVLYGIGARLDQQPELLFTLRGVDPVDLINRADAKLSGTGIAPASGKVLDNAVLSDVFGIDIDAEPPATPTATRKRASKQSVPRTPRVPASSTTPKRATTAKSKGQAAVPQTGSKAVPAQPTGRTRAGSSKGTGAATSGKAPARPRAASPSPRKSKSSK
ncbi:hypothetical protein [Cupriavidus necator]